MLKQTDDGDFGRPLGWTGKLRWYAMRTDEKFICCTIRALLGRRGFAYTRRPRRIEARIMESDSRGGVSGHREAKVDPRHSVSSSLDPLAIRLFRVFY